MAMSSILVKSFQMSTLAVSILLVGCGGGGGNDTIAPPTSPTTGNEKVTTNPVNTSALELLDANGKATRTISAAGATAKVKVADAAGKGISGALVNFTGEGVTFGTTNGSVLTNADGIATISVKPTNINDTGSYQLTATATYGTGTATTAAYNFSLQATNINISGMTAAIASLTSGDSTNITLTTIDAATNAAQNNVAVNFTATCGTFSNDSVTSSNQGNVTTTYKAIDANGHLCEGAQTITATTANGVSQTIQVTVASVQASSIVYTSTSEVKLGAKGSGSSSSGQIEFTVYASGMPAANQNVIISKTQVPSDFSFVSLGNQASQTLKSDASGKVIVQVYPGALPGPVELKATLANDSNIYALSKNVSVATGRASQNGVSISISKNVLENGVDGDTATVTARLVDRLGNAVPDGTVVSFVAEGGVITPNCSTTNGICTVTFTTQNPRPVDRRVSIIAYLEGDKSYTDVNGDNQYTVGIDKLTNNIGDLFRDDNENGLFDAGEFIYKRGATGNCTPSSVSFAQPNVINTCDTNLAGTLRYQFVLGLADNVPLFNPALEMAFGNATLGNDGYQHATFKMYGNNAQTVSMPSGTTMTVTAIPDTTAKDTTGNTNAATCTAELYKGNGTVPAIVNLMDGTGKVSDSEVSYDIRYKNCSSGDQIKVAVAAPGPSANTTTTTLTVR